MGTEKNEKKKNSTKKTQKDGKNFFNYSAWWAKKSLYGFFPIKPIHHTFPNWSQNFLKRIITFCFPVYPV